MKHSFFLVIPKQRNDPQRLREFDEKILKQWIADLPIANPLLASRLVFDYISEMSTLKIPAPLRLDTLEQLRPSFLAIEEYLRSRLVKNAFPKEEGEKKALRFLVGLEREYTINYWCALKELSSQTSWFQGKYIGLAIQRSLKGLSEIVHSHLLMGLGVPDWVWLDLHSLYKMSLKLKKHTSQVAANDEVNPGTRTSSPEETYIEIILLALVDNKGLMQRELKLAYAFIQAVRGLVSLKPKPPAQPNPPCVILIDEDKPPSFNPVASDSESARLYVDFTALYQALDANKVLANAPESRFAALSMAGGPEDKWTLDFLDYLKQRWQGQPHESAPLFEDRLDRYVAIGLNNTCKLQTLNADDGGDEFLARSVSPRLLSCVFKQPGVVSIGNLVSFRKADTPINRRALGIIDSLIIEKDDGKLSFGVQLLTAQAIAVNYLPSLGSHYSGHHDGYKKGLFYQMKEPEPKSFLITDTFLLKSGDAVNLFVDHEEFHITLRNKKNIGLGYWQFECAKTQEKKPAEDA